MFRFSMRTSNQGLLSISLSQPTHILTIQSYRNTSSTTTMELYMSNQLKFHIKPRTFLKKITKVFLCVGSMKRIRMMKLES